MVAKRYKRFPIYSTAAGLVNSVGTHILPLALAGIFSPAIAGLYMLAHRVGSQPTTLVGQAIAQVFLPNAASARREGRLGYLTTNAMTGLLKIGILPIALLIIVAPDLFGIVFGANWVDAGSYLRWLSPWLAAQFVISPFTMLFVVLEKQQMGLTMQSTLFAVRLVSIFIGAVLDSVEVCLALFGTLSAVVYLVFGALVVSKAGANVRHLSAAAVRELLVAAGISAAIIAATVAMDSAYSVSSPLTNVLVAALVGGPVVILRIQQALLGRARMK
jgi:O-antigen/teichoic acid export membrane protein